MLRNLLLSLIFMSGVAGAFPKHPTVGQKDFEQACRYLYVFYGAQCGDLAPPQILYSEFRSILNGYKPNERLGGRYIPGSGYIEINANGVDWATHDEIAFHETIHYILYWTGNRHDRCQSEEAARRATDVYMNRPYTTFWKLTYGCHG